MNTKTAILYKRVSTDEQASGNSLADQEVRIRDYCKLTGIEIVAMFDDDHSAKTFDRPGWNKMMDYVKHNRGHAKLLLFTNWSRFSRELAEAFMMINMLDKLGIQPFAIEQPLDLSVPENALVLSFYIASPYVENRRRSSNTKNGIRQSLKDGRYCNYAPFGYKNGRDENDKTILIVNPEQAKVVKQMFTDYINSLPQKDIMKRAREKGLTLTGRSALQRVITCPLYGGLVKIPAFKEEPERIIKGIHEGFISDTDWWAANYKWNEQSIPKTKAFDTHLPLRGIVCCTNGHIMTGGPSVGRGGKLFYYYRCLKCKGEHFSAIKAHERLYAILDNISLKKCYIDSVIERTELHLKELISGSKDDATRLKSEIESIEKKLTNMEAAFIENKLQLQTYDKFFPKYNGELAILRNQLKELQNNKQGLLDNLKRALPQMQNMHTLYDSYLLKNKQFLIKHIFMGGLKLEKEGYRTAKLNSIFDINRAIDAGLRIGDETQNTSKVKDVPIPGLQSNHNFEFLSDIQSLIHFIASAA